MSAAVVRPHATLSLQAERVIACAIIMCAIATVAPRSRDTAWGSANTKSRMATVEMLVHNGTLAIDESHYRKTMDRVKINGHIYSSKPPMFPVIIAGVYWVLNKTTGLSFAGGNKKRNPAHVTLNVIFGSGSLLLYLLALYWAATCVLRDPLARLMALLSGAMGFFGVGYAVDINNHLPSAALGMSAIACVLHIRSVERPAGVGWYAAAGLFIGLLPTFDIPSTILSIILGLWLVVSDRTKALRICLPIALLPVIAHMALTWSYTGSVLPVQMQGEGVWEHGGYRGPRPDRLTYGFHLFIGHHGILTMVPLVVVAAVAVLRALRQGPQLLKALGIALTVTTVLQLWFYMKKFNWGGTCVGPRHLIPLTGWLMLFVGVFVEQLPRPVAPRWIIALPLMLAVGGANAWDAAKNPWADGAWYQRVLEIGRALQPASATAPAPKKRPDPRTRPRRKQAAPAPLRPTPPPPLRAAPAPATTAPATTAPTKTAPEAPPPAAALPSTTAPAPATPAPSAAAPGG
jgi:hypothetical protein